MADLIKKVTLDTGEHGNLPYVSLYQAETRWKLQFDLMHDGAAITPEAGCYAVLTGVKPDGKILWNSCEIKDGAILYQLTAQTTAVAGEADMQLRVYDPGGALMMSPCFVLTVAEAAVADSELVESQDEVTALTELVTEASGLLSVLEDAEAAASAAEQAAETAQTAASAAEQAAAQALAQAGAAETAADNANTAAQEAEAAAANAREKAREAEAFVQTANDAVAEIRAAALETESAPPVVCEAAGAAITASDASDRLLQGLKVFGKTTQDGTPSPEEPVELESAGNGGGISVTVAGKNLFGGDAFADKWLEVATSVKDESAGTVKITGSDIIGVVAFSEFKENTVYTIVVKGWNTNGKGTNTMIVYDDGTLEYINFASSAALSTIAFTTQSGKTVSKFCGVKFGGDSYFYYKECGIFEGIVTVDDFEPYKGQTVAVSTPEGLAGIPVSSGGNYTDESGQQYIGDYRDYARGVDVQNVSFGTIKAVYEQTNPSTEIMTVYAYVGWNPASQLGLLTSIAQPNMKTSDYGNTTPNICRFGATGKTIIFDISRADYPTLDDFNAQIAENPIKVAYALAEPIETPIPAEELAAYAALRSNKPNTTVFNDAGAYMELQYVADTKTYIDNRFAALSNAVLSSL